MPLRERVQLLDCAKYRIPVARKYEPSAMWVSGRKETKLEIYEENLSPDEKALIKETGGKGGGESNGTWACMV